MSAANHEASASLARELARIRWRQAVLAAPGGVDWLITTGRAVRWKETRLGPGLGFPEQESVMDEESRLRREMVREIAAGPTEREALEQEYGQVWDTNELARDFEVVGFAAPFVVVRRRSDRQKGSLLFRHSPRLYFKFEGYRP